jgi:uncharacterized membrane protein HdeD (DUF308 family)
MEQASTLASGLDPARSRELRRHGGWFTALGVALIILGVIALGAAELVTLASVFLFGWILLVGGVMQVVHAFRVRLWGGFARHLLSGVLSLVVGFLMIANPVAGAVSLTLLLAAFFMVGGIFRIGTALSVDLPGRGWAVLGGIITLLLGIMIWRQWPVSAVWVIGTFVGIDMIFDGWSMVMTGAVVRRWPV